MTHDESLSILLDPRQAPGARARMAAKEHVACCSDCWAAVEHFHLLSTGAPAEGTHDMERLFGCRDVVDDLYRLIGLSAQDLQTRYPAATSHLRWCHACRGRLAEIVRLEAEMARQKPGVAPTWRRTSDVILELVGRIAVEVRETAAAFTAVPDGILLMPSPAAAGALRGSSNLGEGRSRELRLPIGDSGLVADVRLEPEGADRIGFALRFSGEPHGPLSVSIRRETADTSALARYTVRGSDPVLLKGLAPGPYTMEILDKEHDRRFQLGIDIVLGGE